MIRTPLSFEALGEVLGEISKKVYFRLQDKGEGAYAGPHECYGILAEEFEKELLDALHANDRQAFRKELLDIAVACVIGMASLLPGDSSAQIVDLTDPAVRCCRICGCTDSDCRQCIAKTGEPCHWVEQDLCSACAAEVRR